MNILLLGSTGLLGSECQKVLNKTNFSILSPSRKVLDITNPIQVERYFSAHPVDLILHCAGYTEVDQAEIDKDLCFRMNVGGLQNLLEQNKPIIHFSTDYVFDTSKIRFPEGIPEDAEQNALNIYGQSKQEAEKILENAESPWWNIRTSWLYGEGGGNFVDTIKKKLHKEEAISVINDQYGRLTNASDLAHFVVTYFIDNPPTCGHYHLQNSGEVSSWADIALSIQEILGTNTDIQNIPSSEYETKAKRPSWSVLQNTKISDLPDWKKSLERYLEERDSKKKERKRAQGLQ